MVCEICGGSGWIERQRADGGTEAVRCECYEQMRVNEFLGLSGVFSGYKDKTVNDYKAIDASGMKLRSSAATYIRDFNKMKSSGIGMYIYSKEKGSGKTHITSAICVAAIKTLHIRAKFVTLSDLYFEIKAAFNSNETSAEKVIGKYRASGLLVIDDIGMEKTTDWNNEILFNIIDYREKSLLPTLYTSNCPIDALNYDSRIKSRIRGNSIEIHAPEIDNRKLLLNATATHSDERVDNQVMQNAC